MSGNGSGDFISREAAKKQMRNGCHSLEWLLTSGAKTIGDSFEIILDEVPAADVRPVAKEAWIVKEMQALFPGMNEHPVFVCSGCGYQIYDLLDNVKERLHFCPNCGADMIGEAE